MMASSAYWEQVGIKRQDLGKKGENKSLYTLMKKTTIWLNIILVFNGQDPIEVLSLCSSSFQPRQRHLL